MGEGQEEEETGPRTKQSRACGVCACRENCSQAWAEVRGAACLYLSTLNLTLWSRMWVGETGLEQWYKAFLVTHLRYRKTSRIFGSPVSILGGRGVRALTTREGGAACGNFCQIEKPSQNMSSLGLSTSGNVAHWSSLKA